ncbi:MAG: hypothetical protein AVDCRST_MAG53-2962 [uncultured Solirubrobacteraceae bacterium]|uniref:Uncharacterized protein n=1 Tax=uncultured Solirubrobacteraceae bacterium TaxID=1162706 RepID=A0A6J4T664_9ACTN|nr:MAG: hypothetical protein AVDCRST_MAG53-2962 [uncultured Solirubrobacteraceae bacterium]
MRRLLAAVIVATCVATALPSTAAAARMRSCGVISEYRVAADAQTTTCGLSRSAMRDFLRRASSGTPRSIVGRSPKTGRRYRLTRASVRRTQTTFTSLYTGRAGQAVLRVRISSSIY